METIHLLTNMETDIDYLSHFMVIEWHHEFSLWQIFFITFNTFLLPFITSLTKQRCDGL